MIVFKSLVIEWQQLNFSVNCNNVNVFILTELNGIQTVLKFTYRQSLNFFFHLDSNFYSGVKFFAGCIFVGESTFCELKTRKYLMPYSRNEDKLACLQ